MTMTHIYLCLRDTIIMALNTIRDQSGTQTSADKKPQAEIIRQQIEFVFRPPSAADLSGSSELQIHPDG